MIKFILLPLLLSIPLGLYLYCYFLRTAAFWGGNRKAKPVKWIATLLSICAVLWSSNVFGIGAILVFHVAGVAVSIELVNFIVSFVFKKRGVPKNRVWDKVFRSGLLPIVATALILTYGYYNMNHVIETDYTIHTQKIVRKQGYRIAMLSDLHFGTTMDEIALKQYCKEIEGKKPDMIVLGGDIVDSNTNLTQMEHAIDILGSMKSSFGTFFVYGNHDLNLHGNYQNFSPEQFEEQLINHGIHLVVDSTYQLNQEFTLIGRMDRGFSADRHRKTTEDLLKGVNKGNFLLLLDHQPCELLKNSNMGIDLQLSGHTHGGQLWPIGLVNDLTQTDQLTYGHERIGNYQILVTSGMAGWGYPLRTGSHSEYVIIDVKN